MIFPFFVLFGMKMLRLHLSCQSLTANWGRGRKSAVLLARVFIFSSRNFFRADERNFREEGGNASIKKRPAAAASCTGRRRGGQSTPLPYTKQKARTRGCAPFFAFKILSLQCGFASKTAQYLLTLTEVMTTFAAGTSKVASYEPPETNSSRMATSCSSVKESSSLSDW